LLPEEDPRIFTMLLELIYLGEPDAERLLPGRRLPDDLKLYVMADKYGGDEAKSVASERAKITFQICLKKLHQSGLDDTTAKACWGLLTNAVQQIYSNLPSPVDILKQAIVQEMASQWKFLPYSKINVKALLQEAPEFAIDVLSVRSNFEEKDEDVGVNKAKKGTK